MSQPDETSGPPPGWLQPSAPVPLSGTEPFGGFDATVGDFWRWAFSDLRENTTRGVLAEFLVAHAIGVVGRLRKSWENYDLRTASGVRVEVKASGHLQSWPQPRLSRIGFGKLAGLSWDENTGEFGAEPGVRADVFVFAVQTCTDPDAYDALDVHQWEFYVVPAAAISGAGYKSAGISFVRAHATAGPLAYAELATAIDAAADTTSASSPRRPGA